MRYRLSPIFCRPWLLNGITPRLIESHYENNYGGALNRTTAGELRKAGFDARYMAGGHSAWKAIKGAVKLRDGPKAPEAA